MKPLSAWTTPRRLIAPISRHFLPVLQPEPPAWLTTGLMKGSRLPLALFLLVCTPCSSVGEASPAPLAAALLLAAATGAGGLLFGAATAGFAGALCLIATAETRFTATAFFVGAEAGFGGATAALPLGLAATGLLLA